MNAIQEVNTKLQTLPKAPSTDPIGEVLHAIGSFVRDLEHRVEGTPEEDGLLQTIRPHQEAFKFAIQGTAPNFVPREKTEHLFGELPETAFLTDEDGDSDASGAVESHTDQEKVYVDEVLKRAQE